MELSCVTNETIHEPLVFSSALFKECVAGDLPRAEEILRGTGLTGASALIPTGLCSFR